MSQDPHAPSVADLVRCEDWAGLVRYWMPHSLHALAQRHRELEWQAAQDDPGFQARGLVTLPADPPGSIPPRDHRPAQTHLPSRRRKHCQRRSNHRTWP